MATMNSRDVISGAQGEAFIILEGNRYQLANLINVNARVDKNKVEVPILGRPMKGNKTTGATGSGSALFHFNSSILRKLMIRYLKTGEDFFFTMQVTNEDPSSVLGRQTTILYNCNIDGMIIAQLDADAEYLEEEVSFTFDDADLPEEFSLLPEMI